MWGQKEELARTREQNYYLFDRSRLKANAKTVKTEKVVSLDESLFYHFKMRLHRSSYFGSIIAYLTWILLVDSILLNSNEGSDSLLSIELSIQRNDTVCYNPKHSPLTLNFKRLHSHKFRRIDKLWVSLNVLRTSFVKKLCKLWLNFE